MTTIACDSEMMVSDGLITSNDVVLQTDAVKIFKLDDGSIVGFAGNTYNWDSLVSYFNSTINKEGEEWPTITGNYSILRLFPDGKCYTYDSVGRKCNRPLPTAIGSGRDIAMGALKAGANVAAAVSIAADLDVYTGGKFRVLHINKE